MAKRVRYNTNIHAQDRDRSIFEYIGKYGCVNAYHIHEVFFKERTLGRAKDRLSQLVSGGFLHSELTDARGKKERIYWLGRKGAKEIEEDVREKLQRDKPPVKEVAHTLNMVEVCNKIGKRHKITGFIHEHNLKSLKVREALSFINNHEMQIGDGLIKVATTEGGYLTGGEYMIEIDGDYWGKKLASKARSLQASNMKVLYVCFNQPRYEYASQRVNAPNIKVVHIDQL